MAKRLAIIFLFSAFCSIEAAAQFSSEGDDPSSLRWREIRSASYRVIYPEGKDSLAREYAITLEKWKKAVGKTSGFEPNCNLRKPLPVILHTESSYSNGMVTWTPRRMDLFTVPDAYDPMAQPYMDHLVIHESRHVSQMQFMHARPFKAFEILSGELFAGALTALYPGQALLEGDAVCAETELSASGRGRKASFLDYYKACFQAGEYRDFWKWRYGSQNKYTPSYYEAGYVMLSGMRSVYGAQDFTKQYFEPLTHGWPFHFCLFQKTIRRNSGKNLKDSFREISDSLRAEWDRMDAARGPFVPAGKVTEDTRLFSSFSELEPSSDGLFAVRSGLDRAAELVELRQDGSVDRLSGFPSLGGHLSYDENRERLYWSETVLDRRWNLRSYSEIRYALRDGKHRRLTRRTRYFNPSACGGRLFVTEYPSEGGSAVVELNPDDGSVLRKISSPNGFQIVESLLWNGHICVSAVSEEGFGIYMADKNFAPLMTPVPSCIRDLQCQDGRICFSADIDGTQEFYTLSDGWIFRRTSLKNGGNFFVRKGDSLYFTAIEPGGRQIWKTDLSSLQEQEVKSIYRHPFAEKLSEAAGEPFSDVPEVGKPERYSKLAHLLHLHSWMPAYYRYDFISQASSDGLTTDLGLGATAFFQNELGTMKGSLGFSGYLPSTGWRPAGHLMVSYSGWYPVIEAGIDFNNAQRRRYFPRISDIEGSLESKLVYSNTAQPQLDVFLKTYIPWNFSSGGWLRGVIPQFTLDLTNDIFSTGKKISNLSLATASIRAYTMLPLASSCIYPRWGIGAEVGAQGYFAPFRHFAPTHYAYLYGYVPGIIRTHGLRLTALVQSGNKTLTTLSASYAFPFAAVDWSFLSPLVYIRNFEFIGGASWKGGAGAGVTTFSASVAARLSNLVWIPFDTRLGVSCSWTPGLKPSAGLLFSISM